MISDESDEDADALDDEDLLDTYLAPVAPKGDAPKRETAAAPDLLDWPPRRARETVGADVDASTLAWFRANHVDWRGGMAGVLRAWVAARKQVDPDVAPTD
jgi:uncharacterized protein (DUF4415 family)